jgi:RHS repeat-associated protein
LVDEAGTVREHIVYNSFGERVVEQDFDASGDAISSTDPAAVDHLFGYTGRDWDEDTQLQNNRARWYDPEQGRWISNDPSGFSAGDANLYRYVENETTTYTDPNGLEKWTSLGGWNPWSWPLPPRWAISWATGVGAADDEAIELERKRRTMQRLRYINDPSSIGSASGFMNTYRPSAEECDRLSTTAEIGVDANASLLGGSALKASLVGPSTVMRGSTSASSATRVVRGVERVDPRAVRFTQATASPNLSSGSATITALIKELEKNPELVEKLAIEVVEYNGKLYSLNNRRLAAFHQAGLTDVPIVRCSLQDSEIRRRFLQQVKDGLIDDGSKIIIVQGKSGQAQARKLADEAGRLGHLK